MLWLLLAVLLVGCGKHTPAAVPETTAAVVTEATAAPEITEAAPREPADSDFVRVLDYIPTARQELPYATAENFTGKAVYHFQDAYLRYGTVKKLMLVSKDLEAQYKFMFTPNRLMLVSYSSKKMKKYKLAQII